jgi:hypothetical protein
MNLRKTVSLTTLLSFVLLLITSVVLYVTPQGKVAFWANWKMMGLDKEQWGAMHTNIGILFIVAGLVHTFINGKAIAAYLKNKTRKFRLFTMDFNVALAITLAVALLTLWELPPLNSVQHYNASLKDAAAQKYGDPPYGHAEASTLSTFCQRIGLDLDQAIKNLNEAGLKNISASATLADMSNANKIPPQELYNLMAPVSEKTSEQETHIQKNGGMGFGKKTLKSVCTENGLDVATVLETLVQEGIQAAPDQSIRDIADSTGIAPSDLRQLILPAH